MHVIQQVLERNQIIGIARIRKIAGNNNGHVLIEVIAARQGNFTVASRGQAIETHGLLKVREVPVNAHRGGAERNAPHLGIPAVCKFLAHIELLGNEALETLASLRSRNFGGAYVRVVLTLDYHATCLRHFLELPAGVRKVTRQVLDGCRADALRALEVMMSGIETVDERETSLTDRCPLVGRAVLLTKPDVDRVITAASAGEANEAPHRVEEIS